jgi:hypothetical protein
LGNDVNALMYVEPSTNIVKDATNTTLARNENCFTVMGISIDPFNDIRSDEEWVHTVYDFVFVIATTSLDPSDIPQPHRFPLLAEAREAGLPGEELLHGGLFEVALLGDEPVQPAQQPIDIAQRLRDGALFVQPRWKRDRFTMKLVPVDPRNATFPAERFEVESVE